MIEPNHPELSVRRQCELIDLNRSTFYYQPAMESPLNLQLMRLIDEQYTKTPFYGYHKMTAHLRRQGHRVNPKRVRRLMRKMGLQAAYAKPRTSVAAKGHKVYPCLLRGLAITHPHQAWCADITHVPISQGFMYLVAIIDWFNRYVIAWRLSSILASYGFDPNAECLYVLECLSGHGV
jgi:putative transposase